jgi:ferrous iron transport protein A
LEGGSGFVGRLAALGFTPGAEVAVVRNSGRGPVIVSVLDTQIALGRGQADRVLVRSR